MSMPLQKTNIPVAGRIANVRSQSEIEQIIGDAKLLNNFRQLRSSLAIPPATERPFTIGVTASLYDEGVTSVALGLATVLAFGQDVRIAIADCNSYQPPLQQRLMMEDTDGPRESTMTRSVGNELLYSTPLPNLHVLSVRVEPQSGLKGAWALKTRLAEFLRRGEIDYLVLDLPPANADPATSVLANVADALVFVVRAGATTEAEVRAALGQLEERKLAGIVVNGGRPATPRWLTRLIDAIWGDE